MELDAPMEHVTIPKRKKDGLEMHLITLKGAKEEIAKKIKIKNEQYC